MYLSDDYLWRSSVLEVGGGQLGRKLSGLVSHRAASRFLLLDEPASNYSGCFLLGFLIGLTLLTVVVGAILFRV